MKRKTRFDGVDVAAMVAHLQRTILGHKVVNIYDGWSDKIYLFKLVGSSSSAISSDAVVVPSDDTAGVNRHLLLLESGVRFHMASPQQQQKKEYFSGTATAMPSGFTMKLRKHLRGLRLESIQQLGSLDRVVDLRFGSGESSHHILLELYSQGNIILTDREYVILALLREHQYNATSETTPTAAAVKVAVRQIYPVTFATTLTATSSDDNSSYLAGTAGLLNMTTGQEAYQWAKQEILQAKVQQQKQQSEIKKKKKQKDKTEQQQPIASNNYSMGLRALLLRKSSGVHHYGPSVIEHCILSSNLDPNMTIQIPDNDDDTEEANLIKLFESLTEQLHVEGKNIFDEFYQNKMDGRGYILYDTANATHNEEEEKRKEATSKVFLEFLPHLLRQHYNSHYIEYVNFSDAVDTYFSSLEGQILRQRYEAAEQAAKERLSKIKQDQCKRLDNLLEEQNIFLKEARLVEQHAEVVDKALMVVNSALPCMSWDELDQLLEMEKCNKNPIALLIHKLDYEREIMVLKLSDNDKMHDVPNEEGFCLVKVNLFQTAHANARSMFDKYRQAKEKYEKTSSGMTKALKAAERVVQKQLQEAQQKQRRLATTTQVARKFNWFEKFHWFITSDNYLVLAGRDAQQNELLVKRYLRPGDAYLHADVHGAASCILRSKRVRRKDKSTDVLPPSEIALREAGNFTICRSSAWPSKIITSAWWVESHQVSKTAPTGEYLTVGSFMIRGRKNFLPPCQLEMGLAVLFRLGDESSIARHANERRDFALLENVTTAQPSPDEIAEGDLVPLEKQQDLILNEASSAVGKGSEQAFRDYVTSSDKSSSELLGVKKRPLLNDRALFQKGVDPDQDPLAIAFESKTLTVQTIQSDPSEVKHQLRDTSSEKPDTSVMMDTTSKQKKSLSVRDRKLIKKYGSLEAAHEALQNPDLGSNGGESKSSVKSLQATKCEVQQQESKGKDIAIRGKKGKIKKAAKKYADQDDEDRELAMLALQGGKNKQKSKEKPSKKFSSKNAFSDVQQKAAAETSALLRKDPSKAAIALDEQALNIMRECVTVNEEVLWDKFDAEILEQMSTEPRENQLAVAKRFLALTKSKTIANFSASLSGIIRAVKKYGPDSAFPSSEKRPEQEKISEKDERGEKMVEDELVDDGKIDDDAIDDTAELSKFTGLPVDEDTLLYAIPVCAPYSSLNKYKYKVKLTPGSLKRGKAVKQCLEIFLRAGNAESNNSTGAVSSNNRVRDLVKAINEPEWVQAICGDVKISAAGASKIARMQKLNSKKGVKLK